VTTLVDNRRARLSRYVPWIARDYFTNQGPSTILVVLLVASLSLQGIRAVGGQLDAAPVDMLERVLRQLISTLVFLGTFFVTNGIIANDRKQGFYKFLFSKPVAPTRYYAVTFAVYGAGLLAIALVLLGAWALFVRPMFPPAFPAVVLVMFMAYGGIGFILSAAWRFDWMSLIAVWVVADWSWKLWGDSSGLGFWLLHLLPPVHRADSVYDMLLSDAGPIPWGSVAWLGGYGVACFLLGLVVIRRRPLGTS
jgi:hypothetical protein